MGRYRPELDRRLDPDGVRVTPAYRRVKAVMFGLIGFVFVLAAAGVWIVVTIERRSAERAHVAQEYRGPDACDVVDLAAMSALVPHLEGGARAEAKSARLSRNVAVDVTGFNPRTIHRTDVFGSSCTTAELDPAHDAGTIAHGQLGTAVTVSLTRQSLVGSMGELADAWAADGIGKVTSFDHGQFTQRERIRFDQRPDDCFGAVVVDAMPDPLVEIVTSDATGSCDGVADILRSVERTTEPAP